MQSTDWSEAGYCNQGKKGKCPMDMLDNNAQGEIPSFFIFSSSPASRHGLCFYRDCKSWESERSSEPLLGCQLVSCPWLVWKIVIEGIFKLCIYFLAVHWCHTVGKLYNNLIGSDCKHQLHWVCACTHSNFLIGNKEQLQAAGDICLLTDNGIV